MPLHENARFINLFNAGRPITYQENIALQLPGIIQYLPLNEVNGIVAADASGNGRNGSYSGVTLSSIDGPGPSMGRAGRWDGVNDSVNAFSASLASAWNNAAGTVAYWARVFNAAVWADGTFRFSHDLSPTTARVNFLKNTTASEYIYGIRNVNARTILLSTTNWFHVAITWNGTLARAYLNGVQQGADITMSGTLSGTITALYLGVFLNGGQYFWNGYLQHFIAANQEWTAAQVAAAAVAF